MSEEALSSSVRPESPSQESPESNRASGPVMSPPPANDTEGASRGLKDQLAQGKLDLAIESIVRMLARGEPAHRIALEIAAFDALYNEAGAGLGLVLSADVLSCGERFGMSEVALPLSYAANVAQDVSKNRPPRKVPPSKDPGREPDGVMRKLLTACRENDRDGADGLMRGALWRKWTRETIEPWLFELNAAHFFNGGDGLMLVVRATRLLRTVGFEHARRILPGLAYALSGMKRQDEHPEWQFFRQRYIALEPKLGALWERQGKRWLDDDEWTHLLRMVLDGSRDEAWHAAIGVLAAGASVESVVDALARAASERMWRFDHTRDLDGSLEGGWSQVIRIVQYTHALREAVHRHRQPNLIRMILCGVCAINDARVFDLPAEDWPVVDIKTRSSVTDCGRWAESVRACVLGKDPFEAQRAALGFLAVGGGIDGLRDVLLGLVLNDLFATPAMSAQAVSLTVTMAELSRALPEGEQVWPVRATVRFLASPVRESRVGNIVARTRARLERPSMP